MLQIKLKNLRMPGKNAIWRRRQYQAHTSDRYWDASIGAQVVQGTWVHEESTWVHCTWVRGTGLHMKGRLSGAGVYLEYLKRMAHGCRKGAHECITHGCVARGA